LTSQRQESDLKSVLGIVLILQDPAANAAYQSRVPPHQQLEAGVIPIANETLQQLRIPDPRLLRRRPSQLMQNRR
jgi:hypothetical protein